MSLHSHPKIEWVKLSCLSSLFALSVPTLNSVSCDIDTDAADVLLPDAYEKEEDDNDDDEESRTETEDEDDEDTEHTTDVKVAAVVSGPLCTRDRDFMMDKTQSTSAMYESHFYRLLAQRQAEFETSSTEIKRAWLASECDADTMLSLVKHTVSLTNSCTWKCFYPVVLDLVTATLDGEMDVVAWTWACKLVQDVQSELVVASSKPPNHMIEEEAKLAVGQHIVRLRKAASVFLYLSARGTKEGFSNYSKYAPIYKKAFVCKAYEALTVALCHVVTANHMLMYNTTQSINPSIVVHMALASSIVQTGYTVLKNEDGSDDAGESLLLDYFSLRMFFQLMSLYYTGRFHVVNKTHRDAAVQYMKLASECPLNDAAVQAKLKDAIVPFEKMQSDESAPLPLLSLLSHVVLTGLTAAASQTSSGSTVGNVFTRLSALLAQVNELPPLPVVSVADVKEFKAIGIEKMLFGK